MTFQFPDVGGLLQFKIQRQRSIEGIRLAQQNYDLAIKKLTGRFGRRDLLINEPVDQLLALIPVKSSSDVAKLRTHHDSVQFRVSALEGLGVSPDQHIVVLNRVMMRCLPDEDKDDGATSGTETPEDRIRRAKDLLTFLRIQVEVREEGRLQLRRRPYESENMSMATESTGGADHIPSAAALTSSTVSVNQVYTLCNSSGHAIISCNATQSADDKRVMLRYNNGCFRCGTRNHIARLCKKSYSLTWGTCRRRHLTIQCELSRPVEGLPPTAESVALGRPSSPSLRTVTTAQRIIKLTTPSPAAGRWKRVRRQAHMSTLVLAGRVVVGGSMVATPDFRSLSQIGYFLCKHHDEDRVFEIFHDEYITIKHVKNVMHPIRVGPKDGKGCDSRKSMTALHGHCRKQSERLAGIRVLSADCKSPLKSGTEPWNCQMLPKMNFGIGIDTNVVHVYENKENAVAEKAMNSSYIRLLHLINDLNIIGLMITEKPLKSSRYRRLSWKSIRPRRRLESKLDELQQLIASQFLLGSRHISVPQRASASRLANALPLQRRARHCQRLSNELRKRRQ
ncbi:hypothetical protein HPB52_020792 [Rhipicephalus sanguineus]|uniref:CCHC-type domain-containing protein n=1 Tax=Rhipicephalus sanguineus TaxID=34632 RepID=A0A9D4QAQ6_RHISA|nr:hypothetical protein HPB52_020792 [Rhipicephalus sanguineus]